MVWLFGAGLFADGVATILLCLATGGAWKFTAHAIFGLVAFSIMEIHFFWAVLAITVGGRFNEYFNRFSLAAWFVWLIAFISGIPR